MALTAGTIPTAADFTTQAAWTSYAGTFAWTAVTTNPTIGNGSITAKYIFLSAHTVAVKVSVNTGSTTNRGSGNFSFSLPVAALTGDETGAAFVNDGNVATKTGTVIISGTTAQAYYDSSTGAVLMGSTNTFTGAIGGSYIRFSIVYEV